MSRSLSTKAAQVQGDRELTARQAPTRHRLPTRYRPRNVFLGEFKTSVRLPPA